MSRTCLVKHGPEKDEQKNNGCRDVQRDSVNPFRGHGHLSDESVHGDPFKRNDIRHIRAKECIATKQ